MHRAKGDRFVRASELPVWDNGQNPYLNLFETLIAASQYIISKIWKKVSTIYRTLVKSA